MTLLATVLQIGNRVFLRFQIWIIFILLTGCATGELSEPYVPVVKFLDLRSGMGPNKVEEILGKRPTASRPSKSGDNEVIWPYRDSGYVWYDKDFHLKGFAVFADLEGGTSRRTVGIKSVNGYLLKKIQTKKNAYLSFESTRDSNSDEAMFTLKENKHHIVNFFEGYGYSFTDNLKNSDTVIVVRLSISNPNTTQELVSRPVYNFKYTPQQKSVTEFQNRNGQNIGSMTTSSGSSVGTYSNEYAGQDTHTVTKTSFTRKFEMFAFDRRSKAVDENIYWRVVVDSTGTSDNIREIFPYLFFASSFGVENSFSAAEYILPWFHTGVRAMFGKSFGKK